MIVKIIFIVVAIVGIVSVFYVSWFWRAFLIPMAIILLWDGLSSLFGKKGK